MEVKGATLLYTLAGLMITFAGFSALLLFVRQAAEAKLSLLDRYLAKTVMTYIFVLAAAALLPALFALYNVQEEWIWRGSGVLFALPMLSLQITYPRRRRKVVGEGPPPAIYAVLVASDTVPQPTSRRWTIDFFTVIFGFVTALDVIMEQPVEVSERPTPDEWLSRSKQSSWGGGPCQRTIASPKDKLEDCLNLVDRNVLDTLTSTFVSIGKGVTKGNADVRSEG